jgi:hypothetical protein
MTMHLNSRSAREVLLILQHIVAKDGPTSRRPAKKYIVLRNTLSNGIETTIGYRVTRPIAERFKADRGLLKDVSALIGLEVDHIEHLALQSITDELSEGDKAGQRD